MKNRFCLLVLFGSAFMYGQGCSDAGFCTIGAMQAKELGKNDISFGSSYERTTNEFNVLQQFVQYHVQLNEQFSLATKVTSKYGGNGFIDNFGLSDWFISGTYHAKTSNEKVKWQYTLGAKIPFATPETFFLDAEPSNGTFDVIAGISYTNHAFQLTLGYQQPLNTITTKDGVSFKRGGDLLLKPTYLWKFNRWSVQPSTMFIYRIAEDEGTFNSNFPILFDPAFLNGKISGTDGLTINLMADVTYAFKNNHRLQLIAAMPLLNREQIVDGLGRSFVFQVAYGIPF